MKVLFFLFLVLTACNDNSSKTSSVGGGPQNTSSELAQVAIPAGSKKWNYQCQITAQYTTAEDSLVNQTIKYSGNASQWTESGVKYRFESQIDNKNYSLSRSIRSEQDDTYTVDKFIRYSRWTDNGWLNYSKSFRYVYSKSDNSLLAYYANGQLKPYYWHTTIHWREDGSYIALHILTHPEELDTASRIYNKYETQCTYTNFPASEDNLDGDSAANYDILSQNTLLPPEEFYGE